MAFSASGSGRPVSGVRCPGSAPGRGRESPGPRIVYRNVSNQRIAAAIIDNQVRNSVGAQEQERSPSVLGIILDEVVHQLVDAVDDSVRAERIL